MIVGPIPTGCPPNNPAGAITVFKFFSERA